MKGMLQSLEAVIAILMILTVFIFVYTGREEIPEFDTINWKIRGFEAIKSLDNSNQLRDAVMVNSTITLKNRLSDLMPAHLNYDVFVCEFSCGKPDISSEKLTSVSYLVAGGIRNFQPRQIVLYMW